MLLLLGVVVAVTVATYSGSFDGGFVSDDVPRIERNPLLRSLAWANVVAIFTSFDDANYIPVKVLSLALDRRLWGPTPPGFHVTNLVIHVGCALLIVGILLRCGLSPPAAALAAALWAVHPLQVESVAWISERKNVLSGLCFFAAFYLYLGFSARPRARTYAGLLVLYVLALLSKMNTMVLPAICLAYETTFRFRLRRRDVLASLPLFGLGVLVGWGNLSGSPTHGEAWHGGGPVVTWLSSAVVVFRYLAKLAVPYPLASRYQVSLYGSALDGPVLLALAGLVGIAALTIRLIARRRRAAFWILWFFICLLPMLNVIPFRSMMQDRFLYLPMVGAVALVAGWLDRVVADRAARRACGAVTMLLILAAAVQSHRQVEMWDSDLALWKGEVVTAAFYAPDAPYVPPDHDAKLAFLTAAAARDPEAGFVQNNLATMAYADGKVAEALAGFERAARLLPGDATIHVNLGRAYWRLGRPEEAGAALERAVTLAPYDVLPHLTLARFHLAREDAAGARAELTICRRLVPLLTADRAWAPEWAELARLESAQRAGGRR
jgi:protein O-mannosyl-transferase